MKNLILILTVFVTVNGRNFMGLVNMPGISGNTYHNFSTYGAAFHFTASYLYTFNMSALAGKRR